MQALTVVVAHADSTAAHQLTNNLRAHFRRVAVANDEENLREAISRHRANLAIVDLDLVSIDSLRELCAEYSATNIVCVHRAPDFELWNAAVAAGALECCHPSDIPSILNAMRERPLGRTKAAAA